MPRVSPANSPLLVPTSRVPHATAEEQPADWAWTNPLSGAGLMTEAPVAAPATFAPLGYEPGYRYPLVVWLHGEDSCEEDLPTVMRHVSVRNYVAVAPAGRCGECESSCWEQTIEGIDQAELAVAEAIESAAETFNLHDERVFIAGSGAGGSMALRLGLRRPEWFAGAASLNGPLPREHRLLSRINEARRLPLLLQSGRDSEAYPESTVCDDLSLLHSAGSQVSIRQYPGADELTTVMLADLDRWAMGIVCG